MTYEKDRRAPCSKAEQSVFSAVYAAVFAKRAPRRDSDFADASVDARVIAREAADAVARDVCAELGKGKTYCESGRDEKCKTEALPPLQVFVIVARSFGPMIALAVALWEQIQNQFWISVIFLIVVSLGWAYYDMYHAKQNRDRHKEILKAIRNKCC